MLIKESISLLSWQDITTDNSPRKALVLVFEETGWFVIKWGRSERRSQLTLVKAEVQKPTKPSISTKLQAHFTQDFKKVTKNAVQ